MWLLGLDDAQLQSGLGLSRKTLLSYAAVVHESASPSRSEINDLGEHDVK
jgi:hypothetical protein